LIGGSGSFFLAPIIAAAIAGVWGWRGSFIALAVPTAIFGVLFFILLSRGRGTSHVQRMAVQHPAEEPASGNVRRLVAFLVLIVIGGGVNFSISGFIPLYLVDHFGVSMQLAASLVSIINSAGLWASPLGGYFSDRIGRVPIILATSMVGGILIYLLKVVPYGFTIGSVGLGISALLLLIGANNYLRMPVAEAYIMGQVSARRRSTVYGIYYFAMQQAGGIFAPIVGIIVDKYGFYTCFTIASAISIGVTLVCWPFLWGSRD
jgi:MFS family permease